MKSSDAAIYDDDQTSAHIPKLEFIRRIKLLLTALRSKDPDLKSKAADEFEQLGERVLRLFVHEIGGGGSTATSSLWKTPPLKLFVTGATREDVIGDEPVF